MGEDGCPAHLLGTHHKRHYAQPAADAGGWRPVLVPLLAEAHCLGTYVPRLVALPVSPTKLLLLYPHAPRAGRPGHGDPCSPAAQHAYVVFSTASACWPPRHADAEMADSEAASGLGRSVASVLCGGPPKASKLIDF